MARVGEDAVYGLASRSVDGRRAAVEDVARMRDDSLRLNDAQSRAVVAAVELHTAPRGTAATPGALAESLAEIASWDWDGAQLVIEHCDAWIDGQIPAKGFLSLRDEVDAVEASGTSVGISLNWGRSAIEGRDPATALRHIGLARSRGMLRGLMASGAADRATHFGPPWIDAHLPFASSETVVHGERHSLMTEERFTESVVAAGGLDWVGLKVGVAGSATLVQRLTVIEESVDVVSRAIAASRRARY